MLLAAAMVVSMFTGCGSKSDSAADTTKEETQTDDLWTEVLHNSCGVQFGGTCDVTQEAGDTESHVLWVAQHDQNDCNQTDYSAGDNNAGISFFVLHKHISLSARTGKPVENYYAFVNSL